MKRLFYILLFAAFSLTVSADDAATVYATFARCSSIVKTADSNSQEYKDAYQQMLRLYPELQYHAAIYSQRNNDNSALPFAKAYVDMAMMPQFQSMQLEKSEAYSKTTYFVASYYYNKKDYANAVTYLKRYIDIKEPKNRVMMFYGLAKAYEALGNTDRELAVIDESLQEYPTHLNTLKLAINVRVSNGWYKEALPYVDKALQVRPNDYSLLSTRGRCLEGMQNYEEAVGVYSLLAEQKKELSVYKHYATNLYNCAVQYYPTNKTYAISYLNRAIPVLKQVVLSDPTSVHYTQTLAMAYLYTDQFDLMQETNRRLQQLGVAPVQSGTAQLQVIPSEAGRQTTAVPAYTANQNKSNPAPASTTATPTTTTPATTDNEAGGYIEYARNYVEKEIAVWQQKDPFETIDEYKTRVTERTRKKKVDELLAVAKQKYISQHEKKVRPSDFSLQPYDAENRVFLIKSAYGDIILPVPRENDEARNFWNRWSNVSIENPQFDIAGNDMVIRAVDFVTSTGAVYHYSDKDERKYTQANVNMQFDKIDYSAVASGGGSKNRVQVSETNVTVGQSDVDINIPVSRSQHTDRFAFLIGNENYQSIASVPYALHDVSTMQQYCEKTLGIPQTNIRVLTDATFGQMLACVRDIKSIASAYNGKLDILFYYAGHGIPDEASKSAYLLPIDADGTQTETCYSVSRLYTELGQTGAKSILVLMDACFSGSQRGEGMLAQARGVAVKAKPDSPQGRMVAISAATGDETAFPYKEKQHGMFTYFVLKALQENKGNISMGDFADYVQTQVRQQSVVINRKSQTPTVNASPEAQDWRKWSIK